MSETTTSHSHLHQRSPIILTLLLQSPRQKLLSKKSNETYLLDTFVIPFQQLFRSFYQSRLSNAVDVDYATLCKSFVAILALFCDITSLVRCTVSRALVSHSCNSCCKTQINVRTKQSATGRYVSWLLAFWAPESGRRERSFLYLIDTVLAHIPLIPIVYRRRIHTIISMLEQSTYNAPSPTTTPPYPQYSLAHLATSFHVIHSQIFNASCNSNARVPSMMYNEA
mgnify:CR=1 FL=1